LMGVKNRPNIVAKLLQNGRPATTPAALVRWGTTTRQKTVTGTLEDIEERAKAAGIKAPAIIIIGEVVTLRDSLKWFETRPLLGKRIVVTRARAQASNLIQQLTALGAECLQCPTIEVVPPDSWEPLDQAIQKIAQYQWLIFTSANGVQFFFERLFELGMDARNLGHLHTAAIGPVTAERLKQFGVKTDILPKTYQAEAVVGAFAQMTVEGQKMLLPRAKEARAVLPEELARMGAQVDEIVAYQTIETGDKNRILLSALEAKTVDMITFTSSSTVRNFQTLLPEGPRAPELMKAVTIACIGPITADTARSLGFQVNITAKDYTIDGLCKAIVNYYKRP
jgi:uroporphyrinogen III methyltransferase/synthase